MNIENKIICRIIFILVFIILILLQPILYHSIELNADESQFLFMGNNILHGGHPYIEYTDNKPPGIWYLATYIFGIFGKSIYAARGFLYITHALSAILLFLIGKKIWDEKAGMIAAVLYLTGILIPAFEGYFFLTEPFMTFTSLICLFLLIKGNGKKLMLFFSGVAIGLAVLVKQTALLLLFALIFFYFFNLLFHGKLTGKYISISLGRIFFFLGGFLMPILGITIYLWSINTIGQAFYHAILSYKNYGRMFNIRILFYEFASFSIIWIFVIVSSIEIIYTFIKRNNENKWELLIVLWLFMTFIPLTSRQYGHYFIQILPAACLIAAPFIKKNFPVFFNIRGRQKPFDTFCILALICGCFLLVSTIAVNIYYKQDLLKYASVSLQYQIETGEYIKAHTEKNDKTLVYPYEPSVYFFSDRDPCVKLFVLQKPPVDEEMEQIILKQIEEAHLKYIVLKTDETGKVNSELPYIYGYLKSHFVKEKSIGRFEIYKFM